VALFSKTKLKSVKHDHYFEPYAQYNETDDWRFSWPPVMLVADVPWNGLDLVVMTTHAPVTYKASVTQRQLAAAQALKSVLPNRDELIFCGDLNTHFNTETYQIIKDGFIDISGTEPTLHPESHPAGNHGYHVDYVFYRGTQLKHISTRIPVVDGSDHLPVVCEFELEARHA
jgi:endonuclease/exonuclease/phosphatase (EEP) superfamily protein YafD